jgi:integrase
MGRIYKRGPTWWGDYRDTTGARRRESLATRDRAVAVQRLRERELAGPTDRAAHRKTVGGALSHLLDVVYAGRAAATVSCYRQKARHLVRLIGSDRPLAAVDRAMVQRYRAARIAERASDGTVAKELVVLRLALAEQGIEGVVPRSSARYVPRDRHLSPVQFRAVLDHLAPKRRLWLMAAAYLGCRDGELNELRWRDIDLRRRIASIRGRKTSSSHRPFIPIPDALLPWLAEAGRHAKPDGQVVEAWTNRRRAITAAYWHVIGFTPPKNWTKGTARGGGSIAGAPRLSPNDLRRTFASWLKQAGVDSLAVAHLLGHSSTRMVEMVYGRLNEQTYRTAIAALPGCDAGVPPGGPFEVTKGTRGTKVRAVSARTSVPRGGIEPPTRGFSVRELSVLDGGKSKRGEP